MLFLNPRLPSLSKNSDSSLNQSFSQKPVRLAANDAAASASRALARGFTTLRTANREALLIQGFYFATPYATRGWIVWFKIVRLGKGCLATRQPAEEEK
jgi:hypothetical protein